MPIDVPLAVIDDPSNGYRDIRRPTRAKPVRLIVTLWVTPEGLLASTYASGRLTTDMGNRNARLPTSVDKLEELAGELRAAWHDEIVRHALLDEHGFPTTRTDDAHMPLNLHASAESIDESVALLADKGRQLLRLLLCGDDVSVRTVRDFVLDILAGDGDIEVTFDSEIHLPWPLLAIGDAPHPVETFLGYRHRLQYTGVGQRLASSTCPPRSTPVGSHYADISLNGVGRADEVHKLLDERTDLRTRTNSRELMADLGQRDLDDDLMYFWCHGTFDDIHTPHHALAVSLTDPRPIRGSDIERIREPHGPTALFNPFVLLNACHGGRGSLSRALPQLGSALVLRGAKGVLGPLFEIPTLFASHYAHAFIEAYLDGHEAGHITRALARHFHTAYHNPLGLAYALHCGLDARIKRPV